MTRRRKSINIRMTDGELLMVKALSVKYGNISFPDVVRRCVQERFSKVFPIYLEKSGYIKPLKTPEPKQELTDEQFCELCGMKPFRDKESGNMRCGYKIPGGSFWSVDIKNRDLIKSRAKQFGLI